ncbi:MAG: penicillin-binding protein transpeptidase [Gemmatimonadetes bacterium]|nr:penicillin-binding protein transpeptidase [Gemmatimonadota bacterium]
MIRSRRIKLAHTVLALFAIAILGKAASVQLVHGSKWLAQAERQQTTARNIPAPRGEILDATRRVLAQSREMVRLEIAPREVTEPAKLRAALAKLDIDKALIARALDTSAKYLTIPGRFLAVDAADATSLRGVHSYATVMRALAASQGAEGIVGHVDADNKAVDGLELSLDSILRGIAGTTTVYKDSKGQVRESPIAPGTAPTKGNSVVLTINADLQEIAEKALADAVVRMGAEGGDIVILDPHDGEVLAMASRRLDRQTSAAVLTEPFEPGSTMKPFLAAGLLQRGLVRDEDSVDTGNGVLQVKGRSQPIHDDHLIGRAPLAKVLQWSSNIGIVKFSERLSPQQEFETLRDFGFGTPTGLPYPTESSGSLRPPKTWSLASANSMAMGYEIAVTPLQLAVAYAPFANGGELVEPALVKEIIGPDGAVRYRHSRRVVRRVMSKAVAEKLRHMLLDVVDEGTALQAALDNYLLAGKTGTPRVSVRGRYVEGRYNPNFVSLFPGDAPQYVMIVKLTAPTSSIYAASTAAPVTKAILQAAIAARDAALDRSKLASSVVPMRRDTTKRLASRLTRPAVPTHAAGDDAPDQGGSIPFVVNLPAPPEEPIPRLIKPIPEVRGLNLRDAVRSLHSAGFRVQLARGGGAPSTEPAAGALIPTGALVRLHFDY